MFYSGTAKEVCFTQKKSAISYGDLNSLPYLESRQMRVENTKIGF